MADPLTLTVIRLATTKLSTFLSEQGKILGELGQEIQLICDEFGHMKAFLERVGDFNQEEDDPQLNEWIRQVKEVASETENILDEYVLLRPNHRAPGIYGSVRWNLESFTKVLGLRRLALQLQEVKARIKNISDARIRYEAKLPQIPRRLAADNAWRRSKDDDHDALFTDEAQILGFDGAIQEVSARLLGAEPQLKVISLLGMLGLGKTTLARRVYDDAAVKTHFHMQAWVSVSQNCDSRILLKGLIQQLLDQFNEPIPPMMDAMDIYQLKALLKDYLWRGRYVIVFDDVWDTEFWEAFKYVLPENGYGGNRVIITTRNATVAHASTSVPGSKGYVHRMQTLSSQDSWTLFCQKMYWGEDCPDHLKTVAESIVAKCKGLPMAILAIGGLLASKNSSRISEWELVLSRLADEFEGTGMLDRFEKIRSLCYNDLPFTLKACLLYTSLFPSGHDISSHHLTKLLVAERFVQQKEGQTAEETAWDCLRELSKRSFIQLNQVVYNGFYKTIRIHDHLRDFIASKSKDENMATVIGSAQQIRTEWPSGKGVRRLVLDHNVLEITRLESRQRAKTFRSIVNFGVKESVSGDLLANLLTSKLLTIVDLRGMDLEEIPKAIFKLLHLNYLSISGRRVTVVPKSIKKLRNLESLNLKGTSVRELPGEIIYLRKLRHIFLYEQADKSPTGQLAFNGFKPPNRMGELLELQILCLIDATQGDKTKIVREIGMLDKLRKLWITNLRREDGKELCSSLTKLNNLQELLVSSLVENENLMLLDLNHPIPASSLRYLYRLQLYGGLENIPPWMKNLQSLERIEMSFSNLGDDPLQTLQHLPNLFQVCLTKAYQGERMCFKAGGFLKLKNLILKNMSGLKSVSVEKGAMPGINELTMEELVSLEDLPEGIQHLSQLQKLNLWSMNSELIGKLENATDFEEENDGCQRISHVPQVTIGSLVDGRWQSHRLSRKQAKKLEVEQSPAGGRRRVLTLVHLLYALLLLVSVICILVLYSKSF